MDRYKKIFSAEAERKYLSYWDQIASYFSGKNER